MGSEWRVLDDPPFVLPFLWLVCSMVFCSSPCCPCVYIISCLERKKHTCAQRLMPVLLVLRGQCVEGVPDPRFLWLCSCSLSPWLAVLCCSCDDYYICLFHPCGVFKYMLFWSLLKHTSPVWVYVYVFEMLPMVTVICQSLHLCILCKVCICIYIWVYM